MLNLFQQLTLYSQNRTIDSLQLALKNAKHDTVKAITLANMAKEYYRTDPNLSIQYFKQVKTISEKINYKWGIEKALAWLARLFQDRGMLLEALDYHEKCYKIRMEAGNKIGMAKSLNNIGSIYDDQGNVVKALEYFHKSLKISEQCGDKEGMAYAFNNLGYIYNKQNETTLALEYHKKSLKIEEELNNKEGIAAGLISIGFIYKSIGNPSITTSKADRIRSGYIIALENYEKCLKIYNELGDKKGIAYCYNAIGLIYFSGETTNTSSKAATKIASQKAAEYYFKSLKIDEENGNKVGITTTLKNIADLMMRSGQPEEALKFANKAMIMAKELGFPGIIKNSANTLKQIYQKQNKYKEAFEMYELEIKMRDSINNQETQKASIKKQMQYTYEKQEEVAKAEHKKELEKQQAVAEEKHTRQNIIIGSVAIGLLLVIIFASYVFKTLRVTRKQKALIEIKNKETELQKKEIEMKQKELLDSIRYAKRIQMSLIPSVSMVARMIHKTKK